MNWYPTNFCACMLVTWRAEVCSIAIAMWWIKQVYFYKTVSVWSVNIAKHTGNVGFFSGHILVRTSLPRCLCEIDACPPPLCLLLPSYQMYLWCLSPIFVLAFLGFFSRLPFLALLSSLNHRGLASNVAKVVQFLTSYKIIQPVRW